MAAALREGTSVLHAPPGVHWVRTLIAAARGDAPGVEASFHSFVRATERPWKVLHFALGRVGMLAAVASALERSRATQARAVGTRLVAEIWRQADDAPDDLRSRALGLNLGFAHGWAGLLWATARWCKVAGEPAPPGMEARARRLLACATRTRGGLKWPWISAGADIYAPGWCNGAAGFVMCFSALAELWGPSPWLEVSIGAARSPDGTRWGANHVWCGAAGAYFALARLLAQTGDRAVRSAVVAARDAAFTLPMRGEYAASLYRGGLSTLLLEEDHLDVASSWFPGFESPR